MYRAPTGFLQVSAAGYQPYAKNEFFRNEDGSPGYLDDGDMREVRVALVRVGSRPVPARRLISRLLRRPAGSAGSNPLQP